MLISAVMPTRGRREYAARALQCFMSQTWPDKELIIFDDSDKPSFETPPIGDNIRYTLLDKVHNIPEKRNMVCAAASGEIIVHFDSDDWSAPTRIERQITLMDTEKHAVCGFRQMYFWQEDKKQSWLYNGARNYVLGTSLMFKRTWWEKHKWDPRFKVGSDNIFITAASTAKQLNVLSPTDLMVARNHSSNTSPKRYGINWKKTARESLPIAFFEESMCLG